MTHTPSAIAGFEFSCPVFCARLGLDGKPTLAGPIRGTAFAIGGDYAMTAGHVMRSFDAPSGDIPLMGIYGPDGRFKSALIRNAECLSGDVAVLKLDFLNAESRDSLRFITWSRRQLYGLEEVRTVGYALGLEVVEDQQQITTRAFKGRLAARANRFKPVGFEGQPFSVYELSFASPRGLSGSPLLSASGAIRVHGLVIGNSEVKMQVLSSEETVTTENLGQREVRTTELYDTLRLGIATQGPTIQSLESALLGGTIGRFLASHGLLEDA